MKFLYRIYQTFIGYPLVFVATVLTTVAISLGCRFGNARFWSYWPSHLWSLFIIRIMLIPIEVKGLENLDPKQSYVFLANHQGFFDIFLVFACLQRDFKWMMKWEIRNWPFIGISSVRSKHIFVDNRSRSALQKSYEEAREILRGGTSIVIFPEGARTKTGKMGHFKRGAYALADELHLPVVPMTINGSFDIMPRHRDMHYVEWHKLSLTIHKPIALEGSGEEYQKELMRQTYDIIHNNLDEKYQ